MIDSRTLKNKTPKFNSPGATGCDPTTLLWFFALPTSPLSSLPTEIPWSIIITLTHTHTHTHTTPYLTVLGNLLPLSPFPVRGCRWQPAVDPGAHGHGTGVRPPLCSVATWCPPLLASPVHRMHPSTQCKGICFLREIGRN